MGEVWIRVQMTFPESELDVVKGRVNELLRLVREKDDPKDTLHFEYFFNEDTRTFAVIEHFRSAENVADHSSHIYDVGMSIFEHAESSQVEMYGDVTEEVSKHFPGSPIYSDFGSATTR
jgi:hypothetical protein